MTKRNQQAAGNLTEYLLRKGAAHAARAARAALQLSPEDNCSGWEKLQRTHATREAQRRIKRDASRDRDNARSCERRTERREAREATRHPTAFRLQPAPLIVYGEGIVKTTARMRADRSMAKLIAYRRLMSPS